MKHLRTQFISVFMVTNLFCVACLQGNVLPVPTSGIPTVTQLPPSTNIPGECTSIGQTWVSPLDGVTLVCVPAGEFMMGAAEDDPLAEDDEKPQHQVHLDAYWIDSTKVTNVNFGKCMAAGICHPKVYETTATSYIPYSIHPDYQDYPALIYESEPAADYCQWMGRRLPAEAEWEKAARGTNAQLYPWGNTLLDCALANYYGCNVTINTDPSAPRCGSGKYCEITKVDDYLNGASPYGVLNMAGNVWEWTADWYQADYYANSPANNPGGPAELLVITWMVRLVFVAHWMQAIHSRRCATAWSWYFRLAR